MPLKKSAKDPLARLSLAVRELDKLINRANQLAHLSEQALPIDHSTQSDQCTPPQQT
ncbi:hypothetical protein [Nitrospira sp.]